MPERQVKGTRVAPIPELIEESQAETFAEPAVAFRPVSRPPMAHLIVIDDGGESGEVVRLRSDQTLIGRTQGDVLVPHDSLVSSRHLEIERQQSRDGFRWALRDLNSTNGTFVRLPRFRLSHNFELLLGGNRFRFCLPGESRADDGEARSEGGTRGWSAVTKEQLAMLAGPTLIQLDGDDEIARHPLNDD